MYKFTLGSAFFVILLSSYSCWVMTDINYKMLSENDFENYAYFDEDHQLNLNDDVQPKFSLIYPGMLTLNKQDVNCFQGASSVAVVYGRFNYYPSGTKWCGAGDIASNYTDLGTYEETDKCCREHDNCPDVMPAGETKYNITNTAFYTRLHCHCDEAFRECLRGTNTIESRSIGRIYFNALGTQCYKLELPITGCKVRGGWFKRKCLEYRYNTSADPLYQWFDVNNF